MGPPCAELNRRAFAFGLGSLLAACVSARAAPDPSRSNAAFNSADAEFRAFPPPGAALALVERQQPIFHSVGSEWPGGPPVSPTTIFQIASLTKPFTAMVILRLAEQGRLSLDQPAATWLDWLPHQYSAITLRQLLNHTSGVPRDLRRENVDEFDIDEFRRRFLAAEASFPAGKQWEYSNTGYTLASVVAERASGSGFSDLLQSMIFTPAGMSRTGYRKPLVRSTGRAQGYDWQEGRWQAAPPVYSGFGNSGIESTAVDLAKFASALQRGRLLRPESYREMLTPALLRSGSPVQFPFRGESTSYGLGWFLTSFCGAPLAMHGGTIAGYSASLLWGVGSGVSAVALANGKAREDRTGVAEKLAEALLRERLQCRSAA